MGWLQRSLGTREWIFLGVQERTNEVMAMGPVGRGSTQAMIIDLAFSTQCMWGRRVGVGEGVRSQKLSCKRIFR